MIENIGNPEITRKHLSEMQTFYEAQLVAKRHYDALMTSLKPLQDAADVLRASGVVNVDALLRQPVSATKAMIDEMEAEADISADLKAEIDAAVAEHLTDELKGDGWVFVGYDGRDVTGGDEWLRTYMPSMDGSGCIDRDCWWGDDMWSLENVDHRIIAVKPPEGYELRDGLVQKIETDELNDLSPQEGEEEVEPQAWDVSPEWDLSQPVEQEAEPAPAPEGFIPREAGPDPLREFDDFDYKAFSKAGAKVWFAFDSQQSEYDWNIPWDEEMWTHEDMPQEGRITALKLPEGYELVDAEGGKVIRKIDHAAEATAQIEAQAEHESTETEAQPLGFDLPEGAVKNGIGYDQYTGWYADYTVPKTGATGRVYATEGGAGDFQLDLNSDSEPLPHTDDMTEAEPEAAPDETVTEQPESPEVETPSQPEEPKAERKSYDFTGDYTQEEVLAQSGNANFDPRENQADDIAAAERAEFDAPRRQFYNPWNTAAKAEG